MYKLPDYIELVNYKARNGEMRNSIIIRKRKVKEYQLNKTMYDFIMHFKNGNSLDNVAEHYYELMNASNADKQAIYSKLEEFLNGIIKQKWVVPNTYITQNFTDKTKYSKEDVIDDYQIKKIISSNDLTDVYIARSPQNKKVVIKLLNNLKFEDENRFNRYRVYFKDEFNFLKKFNTNYINKAYNYYEEDDVFFTTQFINGINIHRYIKYNKLTAKDKKVIVYKLLSGFSRIHKAGVFHGDIHLGNVLITPNKQVKIIDFGYSNPAIPREFKDDLKIRNGGSNNFIPPERALRSIKMKFSAVENFQSEVYQIGLLIYYIYNKSLPFKAITWKTLVDEKKAFKPEVFKPLLKKRITKEVKAFIIKSLLNDPGMRFKDAVHMLKAWKSI